MEIDEQRITERGLVVLDVTAADEDTVRTDGTPRAARDLPHHADAA
ncbi:DUF6207 family protein [Streptomyces sp. NPDC006307]